MPKMPYLLVKRLIDIVGAVVGLIFLSLLIPFVALLIKLDSTGPVFFRAKRISQGREVVIYKFRTMYDGANHIKSKLKHLNERSDGPFFKITKDPRITHVGRTLRRFWLDELPQLWNVLRGDISLVGPRPYEPSEVANYPTEYTYLKYELAGITGLSQIKGSSNLSFTEVLSYDSYYIKHRSLRLDIYILFHTLLLLFHPSGV